MTKPNLDSMPPEILGMIFDHLDIRSITSAIYSSPVIFNTRIDSLNNVKDLASKRDPTFVYKSKSVFIPKPYQYFAKVNINIDMIVVWSQLSKICSVDLTLYNCAPHSIARLANCSKLNLAYAEYNNDDLPSLANCDTLILTNTKASTSIINRLVNVKNLSLEYASSVTNVNMLTQLVRLSLKNTISDNLNVNSFANLIHLDISYSQFKYMPITKNLKYLNITFCRLISSVRVADDRDPNLELVIIAEDLPERLHHKLMTFSYKTRVRLCLNGRTFIISAKKLTCPALEEPRRPKFG